MDDDVGELSLHESSADRPTREKKLLGSKLALCLLFIKSSTLFATHGKQISSYIEKDTLNEYFGC